MAILTMNGRLSCTIYPKQATAAVHPFENLLKRSKIGGSAPLPPLCEGKIMAENVEDKATLFANLHMPVAHLTPNNAFQQVSFLLLGGH
jgi:hypothetical protein